MMLLGGTFFSSSCVKKMALHKFCFYPCYRKLAANFANGRNKEEEKKKSASNQSLPDVDTNTGEDNGSPHTVNKM